MMTANPSRFRMLLFGLLLWFSITSSFGAASLNYLTTTGTIGTTYSWIDCSSGTTINLSGDDNRTTLNWPFSFNFYDDSYSTSDKLSLCSNGFIRLDADAVTGYTSARDFSNANPASLGQMIALGVADCYASDNGGWVRYVITGTAPNRILTIEYNNLRIDYYASKHANIQVSFYETTNKVVLKLGSDDVTYAGAEMGIYSGSTDYYSYWQDVNNGANNSWIEFTPPPPPVLVTATQGTVSSSYKSLKAAFDAVNNGTHRGVINIALEGSTTEPNSTLISLNQTGTGGANYTSLTILPTVPGVTVSGNNDGGLINLNGADNVVIDGRVNATGTQSGLTFINKSTGSNAYTMGFTNSAQSNSVQFVTIKGGGGSSTNGTVFFGTGTNSNNKVSYCQITNNGTRRINAIYSQGGTSTGTQLIGNAIYDTWSTTASSYGVNAANGTSGWNLVKNSFYETTNFQPGTSATTYSAIYLNNTSGVYTITNNFIGGQDSLCAGSQLRLGVDGTAQNNTFQPIYLNVGTTTTSVQGNIIRNITYRSTNATPFYGFYINAGQVDLGTTSGNVLGDTTGTGSINLAGTSATTLSYGIFINGSSTVNVSNNLIGSITTTSNNGSNAHGFHAISKTSGGTTLISGNFIGSSSTASSILLSSTATNNAQVLVGIHSNGNGTTTISGNTVSNLYNATTETNAGSRMYGIYLLNGTNRAINNTVRDIKTGGAASGNNYDNVCMTGIVDVSTTGNHVINGNNIYNLRNLSSQKVEFYGIYMIPSTNANDTIAGNFVHGFSMLSENTTCYLHGISVVSGNGTYNNTNTISLFNNVVFLGDSISTGCSIFGILKNTVKKTYIYHNTVHLGGTVGITSSISSYAIRERTEGNPELRDIRNNIFYNTRSGAGSNNALFFQVITNLTIDYNDYGWSGSYFAELYNQTPRLVLYSQWLTAIPGQDTHSLTINPEFMNMGGVLATDYKTNVGLDGVAGLGINTDFGGSTRSSGSPTMGAWECYSVDVYNGTTYRLSYPTLKGAFDAINAGTWTGNLTIKLKGSTLESETAVLNASGSGLASYSLITIKPTRNNVSIYGNLNADLIRLNGADNVVFDGRIEGDASTISLTLNNTNTGENACAVKLVESAANNILRYCALKASGTGAASGVVVFSTATAGTGNDNNQLSNCLITGSSTGRPANAIYGSGTTNRENSGNILQGNSFEDNWINTSNANSILLVAGNTDWTISGNSFYHTTAFIPSGTYIYSFVNLNAGVHTITGNYFGGTTTQGLGSAMQLGATTQSAAFYPIQMNVASTGTGTSVQGNYIGNMSINSTASVPFAALKVTGGKVKIGTTTPNQIGVQTGNGNILITSYATNVASYGFQLTGSDSIQVANNSFGSITATTSSAANAHSFSAIYATGTASVRILSNTVGSNTTSGSIMAASTSTGQAQSLKGIHYEGTGSVLVQQNTISNLTNNSTNNVATNRITGIHKAGTGTGRIIQNFITGLTITTTSSTVVNPVIEGIILDNGATVCANNVLSVGSTSSGYVKVYGIRETGVDSYVDSICHNTVYVSGTVTGNASQALSYCLYKGSNSGTSYILNNIFYNVRAAGQNSSRHYGVYLPSVSSVPVLNGNDYYVSGTLTRVGRLNTTDYLTFNNWKSGTSKEANGTGVNPNIINMGGPSPADYKINGVLNGVPSTIVVDFGNNGRSVTQPTIGAWEYALCVEIYDGATFKNAYTTLKGAFDAINAGTYKGNLTIRIVKSTYENETASLSASGTGSALYSRIQIYPTGIGLSVTGSIDGPLVRFSGADNVTLDGRVNATGTTVDLLLSNSRTTTTASTVQFVGTAQGDTLQYCSIKGAGQGPTTGTIHFSTASIVPGNSGNVIRYCTISGISATERPVNAVFSGGSSGYPNADNKLTDNLFFNSLSPATSSNVIYLSDNSTGFTLSNNSLFETNTFTATAANEYALIRIASTTGQGFVVSGNYLGGSESSANGSWLKVGTGSTFYGIYLNVGTSTPTSVQANILKNINYSNVGNSAFTGIHIAGGLVNVGTQNGNTIGATTGNSSIVVTNSTSDGSVYGVVIAGTGTVECGNNSIGAITAANTSSANATHLYGIYKGAIAGNLTLRKNVVGSLISPNSLYASSDAFSSSQLVYGIYSNGTGATIIDSNTVVNITNKTVETIQSSKTVGLYVGNGTNTISGNSISVITSGGAANGASGVNAPSLGLLVNTTSPGQTIYGNSVSRIRNNTTARIYTYGIYYAGPTSGTNSLYGNFVNRILLPSAPPESFVYGFYLAQGAAQVYNNIIAIGDSLLQGLTLYGLYNNSTNTLSFYHNTLYVGGTVAAAMSNTYAYLDNVTGTHNLRNNLLSNVRSGGGKHYAVSLAGTSGLTINFNNYYAGGTNGILGYLGSDRTTLAAWKTATGQDAASLSTNPIFVTPGSVLPLDYIPTASLTVANVLIAQDYSGLTRQNPPTLGALEFIGYFWMGTIDTDWSKSGNWKPTIVPTIGVNAIIPSRVNKPVVNNGVVAEVNNLTIYTGAVVTVDAGGALTVASTLTNNAGSGGLVMNSTEQGTGSFICSQDGVAATVRRYIRRQSARNTAWFTLSSPITTQTIRGTEWTPSGGFGDGTGYDLFVWDESTSAWIYNLNDTTTIDKKWSDVHPQTYFVPGRGYLYSLYDSISTKSFVGSLNNGTVSVPLTISGTGSNKGFQLVGNPYPSSIDWKSPSGFDRSKLTLSSTPPPTTTGYDLWMWSSTSNNFGVYNSSQAEDVGTNNASRYIAPMQGFFVNASEAGNLIFNNNARVHNSAGAWLRSSSVGNRGTVRLKVLAASGNGSDEVMLRFGAETNDNGSAKLFSPVPVAPSLYLPVNNKNYSIRNLTTCENNESIPLFFKPGTTDTYTMTCKVDEILSDTILLEDKRTGIIHNFNESGAYTYSATKDDGPDRFVLHFGSVPLNPGLVKYRVYITGNELIVNLEEVMGEYTVIVFDVNGRIQQRRTVFGGSINSIPLHERGIYLVSMQTLSGVYNQKVLY